MQVMARGKRSAKICFESQGVKGGTRGAGKGKGLGPKGRGLEKGAMLWGSRKCTPREKKETPGKKDKVNGKERKRIGEGQEKPKGRN